MGPALFLLWFAVAICPDWWPFPWWVRFVFRRRIPIPPPPDPGPKPPRPNWMVLVSGLGGILGGWLYTSAWGPGQDGVDAFYAAVTCLGAVAGAGLTRGLVETFLGGRGTAID